MANMLAWLTGRDDKTEQQPPVAVGPEMRSYSPTPSERVSNWIQDALMAGGAQTGAAKHLGSGITDLLSMTPLGIGMSAADMLHAKAAGDPVGAAVAALGIIPPLRPEAKVLQKGLQEGIRAYHGSPHDFDKFDLSKIGTGEGAQAYGHGLYFAENPATAESYKELLSHPLRRKDTAFSQERLAYDIAKEVGNDPSAILAKINSKKETGFGERYGQMYADAIKGLDSEEAIAKALKPGHMYEVNINAQPEHFLDWDKPYGELSPHIRSAIENIAPDLLINARNTEGGDIYHMIAGGHRGVSSDVTPQGVERASAMLNEAGIPGIKYLDQGSRQTKSLADLQQQLAHYSNMLDRSPDSFFAQNGVKTLQDQIDRYGKTTNNYVVFNDKLIDIMKKYGIAGAFAPTAGLSLLPSSQGDSQ